MSKYTQLASEDAREMVEEYIDKSRLTHHMILPSERDFSKMLGINRIVLRKAIAQMTNENKLYTVRGKGTFVAPAKYLENTVACISFTHCWETAGYQVRSDVLSFDVSEASIKISQALNVSLGTPVYELKRLRYIDDNPVSIETSYIPVSLCPDLDEYDFNGKLSLYAILEERYNLRITRQQQTIRTMTLTEEDMNLFDHPKDNYAFYTVAMGCDSKGACIEHSIAISRADIYAITYVADISRNRG